MHTSRGPRLRLAGWAWVALVALPSEASAGSAVLTLTDAEANGVRVDVVPV